VKVVWEYLEVCERLFSAACVAKAAVAAVRKSVAEVAFCGRLGTCAEPPLYDRRRVTTREECRITVDFYSTGLRNGVGRSLQTLIFPIELVEEN